MMRKLLLFAMLAGAVSGCRTLWTRPTPGSCPEPGPVPPPPPVKPVPPVGSLPVGATHIIAALCTDTGAILAAGVNTQSKSFVFLVRGDASTREDFFTSAYRAGVPVVLYTSPVKVTASPGSKAGTTAVSGATATTGTDSAGEEPTFDPCFDGTQIGENPKNDPEDTGGAHPGGIYAFTSLAWTTATAMDGVSDPAASLAPAPAPAPAPTVPR